MSEREIREKLMVSGAAALTDAELLALVIREGTELLSPLELAGKILSAFGGSLSEMGAATVSRLRQTEGCGTKRAVQIAAAAELARRIAVEKAQEIEIVKGKDDIARLFAPLADIPHEEFWVVYLTTGGRIIDRARARVRAVSRERWSTIR